CMWLTLEPTSRLFARIFLRNFERWTRIAHSGLQLLHLLLPSLHGDLLSFIQTVLQVFDGLFHVLLHALQVSAGVSLHFLLNTKSFISAATLGLKRALQGVNGPLHVPLALLHFFIFFRQFSLHFCFDLVKLKLGP
uniref:Uncharacterized protein n=1 Tax=Oryzias melastigma TaxID=30732 RepID=A0A3B3DN70_ORYME